MAEEEKRLPKMLKVHPHLFRHTFTTHCYQSGMEPASIMTIVGHAHFDMLEHYTHPDKDFIIGEFNKYTSEMHNY